MSPDYFLSHQQAHPTAIPLTPFNLYRPTVAKERNGNIAKQATKMSETSHIRHPGKVVRCCVFSLETNQSTNPSFGRELRHDCLSTHKFGSSCFWTMVSFGVSSSLLPQRNPLRWDGGAMWKSGGRSFHVSGIRWLISRCRRVSVELMNISPRPGGRSDMVCACLQFALRVFESSMENRCGATRL